MFFSWCPLNMYSSKNKINDLKSAFVHLSSLFLCHDVGEKSGLVATDYHTFISLNPLPTQQKKKLKLPELLSLVDLYICNPLSLLHTHLCSAFQDPLLFAIPLPYRMVLVQVVH